MARGNQRDKSREKNLAKAAQVKSKTTMTGTQYQKSKEDAAAIMREKQKRADEKKTTEGALPKKK